MFDSAVAARALHQASCHHPSPFVHAHVGSPWGVWGAEPAYCCSCPWLRSESQRGSGYVRDAAIVTLHCLKLKPAGIVSFAAHQSRLKGEPEIRFRHLFFLETLPLALENYCWRSIPVLHQEQARKQTNMDAVRYSRAADDACTEIMLLASYSQSLILLIDNLQRDAIRIKGKFDPPLVRADSFWLKCWFKLYRASNRLVAIHLCQDDTHLEPAIPSGVALSFLLAASIC